MNEFIIKNGFISKGNPLVEGSLTASTISGTSLTIGDSISSQNRILRDSNNLDSVRWENRYVVASDNTPTVDWENTILTGFGGATSLNWTNGEIKDTGPNLSINWISRLLADGSEITVLDWENKIMTGMTTIQTSSLSATTFNLSGSQIESSWTSYVPTWTGATSPAIGNGTIEGYYKLIGKTCFVRGNIAMGTTTTYGTGEWLIGLPFPAKHADGIQITVSILQASVAWFNAIMNGARAGYTDKTAIQYQNTGGTTDSLSPNTPFTWGAGSRFTWNGSYEIS